MRIKIIVSYDGSKFCGFQRQKNAINIQKSIENALSKIYNTEVFIKGAGRTDAGVHADGQVCHFDVQYLETNLKDKLNSILQPYIKVKSLKKVSDHFHSRKSAKKKEYIYKINLGKYKAALRDYYYEPNYKIDISLMKEASKYMIGTHEFNNFVAGERESYTATIYNISFNKMFDKLEIHFIGTGFYRYMVRKLVGALLEVGKYKESASTIKSMINNPNETKELMTAPPEGLYLHKIWY